MNINHHRIIVQHKLQPSIPNHTSQQVSSIMICIYIKSVSYGHFYPKLIPFENDHVVAHEVE